MIDPFELKKYAKVHPRRLVWTGYSRCMDLLGQAQHRAIADRVDLQAVPHVQAGRGTALADTAVTSVQAELLDRAVQATEPLGGAVLELGSYRGATTARFAAATHRKIFAIDPYIGYGGWEEDMRLMRQRTEPFPHVQHIRLPSGAAAKQLEQERFSFIFIDAVHDYANTSFDFDTWVRLALPGALIAFHDVDDFPGTNLALRRILARNKDCQLWGYCPNLAILKHGGE